MTASRVAPPAEPPPDDEAAFASLAERHRRELHLHCYRMLASFDEAEDAVQETLLRAWRARGSFDGTTGFRAWLYRIATNVCLDQLRRSSRHADNAQTYRDMPWLQPYPDALLDEVVATDASLLETSVPAANSALQRARATMQEHLPARRAEWSSPERSERERELLDSFIAAHERGDAALAVSIAAEHLRVTMPPHPYLYEGLVVIGPLLEEAMRTGEWRLVATSANRMPTAASYLRVPGDTVFRAFKFDVLDVRDGLVSEITTFGPELFTRFGLPTTL